MSVGIWDADFMTYGTVPFNLEAMKIASYYKGKREVVIFSPLLAPERFQKFIVRKDWDDGEYPNSFFEKNVEYGGHAFSGENYIPLALDIEKQYPDKYLYDRQKHLFINDFKTNEKPFRIMRNAEHVRLSLDGKTIWNDYEKALNIKTNTNVLFFHDYDLNKINGSFEEIKMLLQSLKKEGYERHIGMKFPVRVNTLEELLKWSTLKPTTLFFFLQYDGLMNNEDIVEVLNHQTNKSITRQLFYNVTYGSSSENDFIKNVLPKIYEQAIILRRCRSEIVLKYSDNFFIDKRWERLLQFFNHYIAAKNSPKKWDKNKCRMTLYEYITSYNFRLAQYAWKKETFTTEELKDLFQMVREKNYDVFTMFYQSY